MKSLKYILSMTVMVLIILTMVSCAGAPSARGASAEGSGKEFLAADSAMIATEAWGSAVRITDFTADVMYDGVPSIEAVLPYGETAVVWHFSGLDASEDLEMVMDVNLDAFMTDSLYEVFVLPGNHPAAIGTWPKELWVEDGMVSKWVDSVGRFAGEPWPDTTDGWETVRADAIPDEEGKLTVMMIFNHFSETPPLVQVRITNPEVRARSDAAE